ncbi:formimidoylglutamase [Paraferrimonas sedimenticola]|uniref:Formimidoylglutamase HutG n=1 Tax=Paraferrimonas sedimenticola TaxID=375674 RepID=A0AA37RYB5_9GAMM|nr:formimidoylglutamase [Paraferrimonas sedimenticola]GLP97433.1 formimidoylglutamase HutG [Paraferrimonas sedimenticola]
MQLANSHTLEHFVQTRAGEIHLGQRMHTPSNQCPDLQQALSQALDSGVRFALIGINEDHGPRANLGRGGADQAWQAALTQLANLQSNQFLDGSEIMVLGSIDAMSLPAQASTEQLRLAVAELDRRVTRAVQPVIEAGITPIVIGGGHNNALPLLQASSQALGRAVNSVNFDPHSDFRPLEGRHSGNGFSYAAEKGYLDQYHVVGLHESKNSQASLEQLSAHNAKFYSYQSIWQRREQSLEAALEQVEACLAQSAPLALEVDLDVINGMPSSASTIASIPLNDVLYGISRLARQPDVAYLHLAEGAPACAPEGLQAGLRSVGQALAELILAFVRSRNMTCGE